MTECSRCGDCCERIPFPRRKADITRWLADPYIAGRSRRDLQFISTHWHLIELRFIDHQGKPYWPDGGWYTCDAFDKITRLCTAHGERPPVCRDYPWYEDFPEKYANRTEEGNAILSPRCSFRADIPPGNVGALLPIVSVR